jgi:hypothetical protein
MSPDDPVFQNHPSIRIRASLSSTVNNVPARAVLSTPLAFRSAAHRCYYFADGEKEESRGGRTRTQRWKSYGQESDARATLEDGPQRGHGAMGKEASDWVKNRPAERAKVKANHSPDVPKQRCTYSADSPKNARI